MVGDLNPWLMMWAHPRNAIRAIVSSKPKYGVLLLASAYSLQNFFYFSNYWSVGLSTSFYAVLIAGIILCPFIGWIWVYLTGFILYFTGKWLKGAASQLHLRAAAAWSKIPTTIGLIMWFLLLVVNPKYVFIQDAGGPTALFISFITLILSVWSLVLLIQSIREIQSFSLLKAIINVFVTWVIFSVFLFFFFSLLRYLYILTL